MPDRILTSHAGSVPRPEDLIALNERRAAGDSPTRLNNPVRMLGRGTMSGLRVREAQFSLQVGLQEIGSDVWKALG
jgi:hypothetical protein